MPEPTLPRISYCVPDKDNQVVVRTARLEDTWYDNALSPFPGTTTHDSRWIIDESPNRDVWMGYTAHDGSVWFSKVSCEYDGGLNTIRGRFRHRGPAPAGYKGDPEDLNENDDYGKMGCVADTGQRVYVRIADVTPKGAGTKTPLVFTIEWL
jgi:hypothetical protein